MVAAARAAGAQVVAVDRDEVDITDAGSCWQLLHSDLYGSGDLYTTSDTHGSSNAKTSSATSDVVVNCAAWTAVDAAESQEGPAFAVNAVGPANIARAASAIGARMVQISTDYVFAGDATQPYVHDAPLAPASAYGRSKAAGEWAVAANTADYLLVRTAWLYGAGGPNFPKTMARLGASRDKLTVVSDQEGQPTWTADLADLIVRLVAALAPTGIYHGTASGASNWCQFAQTVMTSAGLDCLVEPVTTAQYTATATGPQAHRPAYSVLGHQSLTDIGIEPIGNWRQRWEQAAPVVLASV